MQSSAIYGASEIYGCTVIIVIDAWALVIMHFPEGTGSEINTLESESETNDKIIGPLLDELFLFEWTDQVVAYIVHYITTPPGPGIKLIKENLVLNNLPVENIKEKPYTRLRPTTGHRGKVAVTWDPLEEGSAELRLYIGNDDSEYVRQFDQDGTQCDFIG